MASPEKIRESGKESWWGSFCFDVCDGFEEQRAFEMWSERAKIVRVSEIQADEEYMN